MFNNGTEKSSNQTKVVANQFQITVFIFKKACL